MKSCINKNLNIKFQGELWFDKNYKGSGYIVIHRSLYIVVT